MKRDMDLVRRIALEVADMQHGFSLGGLEEVDPEMFAIHVIWMREAGLIVALVDSYETGEPPKARVTRLTWQGCEFVDAVRSETLWKKAKEEVIKPAGSFTFGLLTDWLKVEISQGLPTLRSAAKQIM